MGRFSVSLALLCLQLGCSSSAGLSDSGATRASTIGPAGGTVTSNGATLTIPRDALTASVEITVAETPGAPTASGATLVGPVFTLGPSGMHFAKPVSVTLPFVPAELPAGATADQVAVYTSPVGSTSFASLGGTLVDATHVQVTTTHFSCFEPAVPNHPFAGGGLQTLASGPGGIQYIAVDATSVYWTEDIYDAGDFGPPGGFVDPALMKVQLVGDKPATLASPLQIGPIALGSGNVYGTTTSSSDCQVQSVAVADGNVTTLASNQAWADGIAVAPTGLYWTVYGGVMTAQLDGSGMTSLVSGQAIANGAAIAVDATSVYWTDNGAGTVMKVQLDGGNLTTLASGQPGPEFIAVDAANVYWTNQGPQDGGYDYDCPWSTSSMPSGARAIRTGR